MFHKKDSPHGKAFRLNRQDFEPAYLKLYRSGELQRRAEQAINDLSECMVCPRDCGIDRLAEQTAVCKIGRYARVSSYFAHRGEEDCLRGWRGSGTLFFASCNLKCVFCQNHDISQIATGKEVTVAELADMLLELQGVGCHNINFVTPEHVVPQVLEGLVVAAGRGLRLPIVYNTSAYDSLHSLKLMDGVVDIYLPDFKFWDPVLSLRYLKARDYPHAAREALREMHRQVGVLKTDEQGLALRGVLVRHLVMPGDVANTADIMRFLSSELSPDTYVNVMAQYHPDAKVNTQKYFEINRRISGEEYRAAIREAHAAGLWRLDERRPFGMAGDLL